MGVGDAKIEILRNLFTFDNIFIYDRQLAVSVRGIGFNHVTIQQPRVHVVYLYSAPCDRGGIVT